MYLTPAPTPSGPYSKVKTKIECLASTMGVETSVDFVPGKRFASLVES